MRRIIACCALMSVSGTGCSLDDWIADNFPMPIDEYEWQLYSSGFSFAPPSPTGVRHVDELVAQRGPPDLMFEARPRYGDYRDGIPAVSYVYYPGPGQKCYDTYVVVAGGTIARYYCR